jgi:hypothetical protein
MTTSDIAYTPVLPEGWARPRGFSPTPPITPAASPTAWAVFALPIHGQGEVSGDDDARLRLSWP